MFTFLWLGSCVLVSSAAIHTTQARQALEDDEPTTPKLILDDFLATERLLNNERVQAELDIIDEQKDDLDNEFKEFRRQHFGRLREIRSEYPRVPNEDQLRHLTRRQRESARFGHRRLARALESILLPPQIIRLNQLLLQRQGVYVYKNQVVLGELDLSDEQRDEIEEIIRQFERSIGRGILVDPDLLPRPTEAEVSELEQEAFDQIWDKLNDNQRGAMAQLFGSRFDFERSDGDERSSTLRE